MKKCLKCNRPVFSRNAKYCEEHTRKGKGHCNNGYVRISINGQRVYEHRYIMELHLGRQLYKHENIHHRNGDRSDNRLSNLELWSTSQPSGQSVEEKLNWAHNYIRQYDNNKLIKRESSGNERSNNWRSNLRSLENWFRIGRLFTVPAIDYIIEVGKYVLAAT